MPDYTVRDKETGKTITFRWNGDAPPTDTDLAEVFAQARHVTPPAQETTEPQGALDRLWAMTKGFTGEALAGLNPVTINRGVQQAFWHPLQTAQAIGKSQGRLGRESAEAFRGGDVATGVRKGLNYLIPLFGPRLDESADLLQRGEIARGLGAATDVALQTAGPMALSRLPQMRVSPAMRPRNQVMADAAAWGESHDIPLDAATATGRNVIGVVQKRASDSLGGAGTAEAFKLRQADRLKAVGQSLTERAYPSKPIGPEQAGQGVQDALLGQVRRAHDVSSKAYNRLRTIEADPRHARTVTTGTHALDTGVGRPRRQGGTSSYPRTPDSSVSLDEAASLCRVSSH